MWLLSKLVRLSRRSSNQCSLWQFVGFLPFVICVNTIVWYDKSFDKFIVFSVFGHSSKSISMEFASFFYGAHIDICIPLSHFLESSDAWPHANQSNDREPKHFRWKNDEDKVGAFGCIHARAHRHRHPAQWTSDMAFCTISMFCVLWLTFCCAFKCQPFAYLICAHTIINFAKNVHRTSLPASPVPCAIYRWTTKIEISQKEKHVAVDITTHWNGTKRLHRRRKRCKNINY